MNELEKDKNNLINNYKNPLRKLKTFEEPKFIKLIPLNAKSEKKKKINDNIMDENYNLITIQSSNSNKDENEQNRSRSILYSYLGNNEFLNQNDLLRLYQVFYKEKKREF